MAFKKFVFIALIALSACSYERPKIEGGQYWQRAQTSEAVYQQGPKVQQMLNRDIGRCVADLRELERLGAVKNPIPTDPKGKLPNPDEKDVAIDDPARDLMLIANGRYYDFDGCMAQKGWERVYEAGDNLLIRESGNYETNYDPEEAYNTNK